MFRSPNEIVANWIKIATRRIHEQFTKLNEPDWCVCDENHLVLIETQTQPNGTAANGKLPTLARILGEQSESRQHTFDTVWLIVPGEGQFPVTWGNGIDGDTA
jgi:hypothetical protein